MMNWETSDPGNRDKKSEPEDHDNGPLDGLPPLSDDVDVEILED